MAQKFRGKLCLASEAVDYPFLSRTEIAAQGYQFGPAAHCMYQQRLAQSLAQTDMFQKHLALQCHVRPAQRIESALSYGKHMRMPGGTLHQRPQYGSLCGAPRMYAGGIPSGGVGQLFRLEVHQSGGAPAFICHMGMDVVERPQCHGTGSYPLPPQG